MTSAVLWTLVVLVLLAIIVIAIFAKFYQRATREISLVKTGIGGRRTVLDGGTIVIPVFHEITRVNMQTMRLEVQRAGGQALITKDRLRVDVGAEFYVSVIATEEGVSRAAQTLGSRTFDGGRLRELIEGKLVDALRSVAARMTLDELHENRAGFASEVRDGLIETLERNGLELDAVSLTALDQTAFEALDENNVFNAVGMRKLAEVIATSKKERAQIDADAEVSVRRAAMEAAKMKYEIDLAEQEAEISQVQQIESLKASQLAEVARRKAESERAAAQAKIDMEREIRTADIARDKAIREAEIVRDLELHEAEIAKNKELQEAEIARERDIEIANQERQIQVSAKSEEHSKALASAETARIAAIEASEATTTTQMLAEAERAREIAVIAARREGQVAGARIRNAAEAEMDASAHRAQAKISIAKGEADAAALRAEARKKELLALAEGQRAAADADNALEPHIVAYRTEKARLEALPQIVSELVKPAEKIDSIRVHNISGLGSGAGSRKGGTSGEAAPVNQILESIMDMAVQLPALKKLGKTLGMGLDEELSGVAGRHGGRKRKKRDKDAGKN